MSRRRIVEAQPTPTGTEKPTSISIPHDPINEAAVLAGMLAAADVRARLVKKFVPDQFQVKENREVFQVLQDVERRKLACDLPTIAALGGTEIGAYAATLMSTILAPANLDWHVANVLWDSARATAARGPVPAFLEAFRDPRSDPGKVKSLARQIALAFDGYEDRRYLLVPEEIVRERMADIAERVAGRARYPYGIPDLDFYPDGRRRLLTAATPGEVTVVTAISGGGKTTFAAHLALGLLGWIKDPVTGVYHRVGLRRRVLYGAWEMTGNITTEILATISLGWSRTEMAEGTGPIHTPEGKIAIKNRMEEILDGFVLLDNPFRRHAGEKTSNARNLDILQGYLADAAVDVFIGDLWKRVLSDDEPSAEEDALLRQQAMAAEMRIHAILLQQQRLKDIETRQDSRPTREGIKGSSAWVEIADTILGPHYPYLTKMVDKNKFEIMILKQRQGPWPLAIEFDWVPEAGSLGQGRPVDYMRKGSENEFDIIGPRRKK